MNDSPPAPGGTPEPIDAAALQPGARINEYTIVRVLGVGGFGITYLARDAHLELTVALKEYFPVQLAIRLAGGEVQPRSREPQVVGRFQTGLQRFVAEARALATFRHPNIVRVLRYFEAQGTACIVMEYETGQSLRSWMKSKPPLQQDAVLALIRPLLDGLEAVHAAGFLHRDIKPDNIFVRSSGSPVLLDFGAARRVCAGTDLTNIVSPGFAPFEQYHTRGRQGPWTDIYSIGAVMYWMATREKPLDAASRVKVDTMPRFADLADRSEFDPAVVRVIDWALELEEKRRPQSVAELRAALGASYEAGEATVIEPPSEAKPATAAALPADAPPFSVACGRRNILCTILFIDLVGYTTLPVDEQVAAKQLTNRLIAHAVQTIAPEQRLAIDTGDGAAICFIADPQQTLDVALMLRRLMHKQVRPRLRARMGLHLGPVRIVSDINDRRNVVGDGINVAQRVMDFAQPDQLLVSSAFHDAMVRTCDTAPGLFRYAGPFQDKHGRVHEVHSINAPPGLRLAAFCQEPPGPYASDEGVPARDAEEVAEELSRLVGPLARLLVQRARHRFSSPQALRQALASFILETAARAEFLGESLESDAPEHSSHTTRLAPRPQTDIAPRLRSAPPVTPSIEVVPRPVQVAPPALPAPGSTPLVRRSSQPLDGPSLAVLERVLGQHIGPLAKVLMAREREAGLDGRALIQALAGHIAGAAQKEAFLHAVHREMRRLTG